MNLHITMALIVLLIFSNSSSDIKMSGLKISRLSGGIRNECTRLEITRDFWRCIMAKDWWDYSWNLAVGCTKVSVECQHCWAEVMAKRLRAMGRKEYQDVVTDKGHWTNRVSLVESRLGDPLKLRKPRVIAVNLMGDLFHEDVPWEFIARVFGVMYRAPKHRFIILTKRPDRAVGLLPNIVQPLSHVWIGTSAGNQTGADARREAMERIASIGWNTWVS